MKPISDQDFENQVLKAATPVLVDFSAEWCEPCKKQVPILEKLGKELGEKLSIVTVDIDQQQATAGKFRVLSIPTLILFHRGEVAKRWTGFTALDALKEAVAGCA